MKFNCQTCKVIFFDVGYTLVDETQAWLERCKKQSETDEARRLGLSAEKLFREIEKASRQNLNQFCSIVKKYSFKEVAPYTCEKETVYSDAKNVLQQLKRNYRLGIIANQISGLNERLTEFGLDGLFDYIVSSAECGYNKPDTQLFTFALKKANCMPNESIMIGDRIDNDIAPAKQVGMHTIWIRQSFGGLNRIRNESEKPDFIVDNLTELLNLFEHK